MTGVGAEVQSLDDLGKVEMTSEQYEMVEEEFNRQDVEIARAKDKVKEIDTALAALSKDRIRFAWGSARLPKAILKLDSPFQRSKFQAAETAAGLTKATDAKTSRQNSLIIAEKFLKVPGSQASELATAPDAAGSEEKEPGGGEGQQEGAAEEKEKAMLLKQEDLTLVAKLWEPLPTTEPGRVLIGAEVRTEPQSCTDMQKEAEAARTAIYQIIAMRVATDWQTAGVLPILSTQIISRSSPDFPDEYLLACISPFAYNGTAQKVLSQIGGRRSQHWFEEDLLLLNLKAIIRSFAMLESRGIIHGGICPSNLYVSSEGSRLLVGDFIPESYFLRWCGLVAQGQRAQPKNNRVAPELYRYFRDEVVNPEDYVRLNLHKNDVFCLGVTFYHLLLRKPLPEKFSRSRTVHEETLNKLTSTNQELVALLRQMMIWKHENRPSFLGLITFRERAVLATSSVTNVISNVLGFKVFTS